MAPSGHLDGCGKQLRRGRRLLLEYPVACSATRDGETAAALRGTDLAGNLARLTGLAVAWWTASHSAAAAGLGRRRRGRLEVKCQPSPMGQG